MKRVVLFANGTDDNGKVFFVTNAIEELLEAASKKFEMTANRIFTAEGGEINDVKLIRDYDVLYVSNGQDFVPSGENNIAEISDWVTLNIGGQYFTTTKGTLINKEPTSMLARMFSESQGRLAPSKRDRSGAFLIDRSPTYFEPLLNYLRHGKLILDPNLNPVGVLEEARFYGFQGIVNVLTNRIMGKKIIVQ